ncbi:hypothetical protein ONZ45_g11869 [Pleurotus djamor]|nr:hypothetical protein ONZ45_g11869 [Pleurotus djamor]
MALKRSTQNNTIEPRWTTTHEGRLEAGGLVRMSSSSRLANVLCLTHRYALSRERIPTDVDESRGLKLDYSAFCLLETSPPSTSPTPPYVARASTSTSSTLLADEIDGLNAVPDITPPPHIELASDNWL